MVYFFFNFTKRFWFARTPFFELKTLEPGVGYDILVMAVNKKGKSAPVMLQGYTLKNPEKQTGMCKRLFSQTAAATTTNNSLSVVFPFSDISPAFAPAFLQIKPFFGTLLGILGTIVLILLAVILVAHLRNSSNRDRTRASQINNTMIMTSTLSPSQSNGGVLLREASSCADSDKNPDIIPQGMCVCVH